MRTTFILAAIVVSSLFSNTLTMAEESTLKEGARKVGQEAGEMARKVGEAGMEAGKKVAEVAVEVGHATREGAKDFTKVVKGEPGKQSGSRTGNSASSSAASSARKSN